MEVPGDDEAYIVDGSNLGWPDHAVGRSTGAELTVAVGTPAEHPVCGVHDAHVAPARRNATQRRFCGHTGDATGPTARARKPACAGAAPAARATFSATHQVVQGMGHAASAKQRRGHWSAEAEGPSRMHESPKKSHEIEVFRMPDL